jgi:hypothetical protein
VSSLLVAELKVLLQSVIEIVLTKASLEIGILVFHTPPMSIDATLVAEVFEADRHAIVTIGGLVTIRTEHLVPPGYDARTFSHGDAAARWNKPQSRDSAQTATPMPPSGETNPSRMLFTNTSPESLCQ